MRSNLIELWGPCHQTSDAVVFKGRSVRLEDWAVEKVVFDGFGTEVATAKVIFGHSSLVKKVRRRECPDKIWISW